MESTNIIVEAKKISELPISLDFSEDAIVLIVDKGKTMQLNVDMLIQVILEKAKEADGSLEEQIKEVKNRIDAQSIAIEAFKGLVNSLRQSVTNKFKISDAEHENMNRQLEGIKNNLDSVIYCEEAYDYGMMTYQGQTYSTDNVVVGTRYGYTRGEDGTGYFGCIMNVKKGSLIAFEGCQKINFLSYSKYLVVTDADDYILELIPVTDILQDGYVYEVKQDGKFILSAQCDMEHMELPIFKIKTFATGVPKVSADDEGKILQVVNGCWKAVDIASAPVGNEVEY